METKQCRECKAILPVTDFGTYVGKIRPQCKLCYNKRYRKANAETNRKFNASNPGYYTPIKQLYRKNEQVKIRNKVYGKVAHAIKMGKLIKPKSCSRCRKESDNIEAHHEDYSKPLEVIWLCLECHHEIHRK